MSYPKRRRAAADMPLRANPTTYLEVFAKLMLGREKRPRGDLFGLSSFGVNRDSRRAACPLCATRIPSRTSSSTSCKDGRRCTRRRHGRAGARHLRRLQSRNRRGASSGQRDQRGLEVAGRAPGDVVTYPDDDIRADFVDGRWRYVHKDGTPY